MNKLYTKYSPTSKNRLQNCKKNVIHLCTHDTLKHELAKCVGAIMVHRYGDVKFTGLIKDIIDTLDFTINAEFKNWKKEHTDFLTEAWKSKDRRVDLVNLKSGDEIEFECNHKIKKEGSVTIYI